MTRARHRYGRARSQFAELSLPDGDGPHPVAVLIHGGFWKARYSRKLMHPLCADLVDRGWATWNLEYRRLGQGSGGGWPATFDDVNHGIDHLGAIDAPLDLSRVVAIGHSAGGHLAAWAAVRGPCAVPVTAVVAQAGVIDLELAWELQLSKGVVARLLGGTAEQVPERYAHASPAARLPLGVPTLLTHGGRDDNVPPRMSEGFARRARAAGDDCELVLLEQEDHFGHLDPANPLWRAVTEWIR